MRTPSYHYYAVEDYDIVQSYTRGENDIFLFLFFVLLANFNRLNCSCNGSFQCPECYQASNFDLCSPSPLLESPGHKSNFLLREAWGLKILSKIGFAVIRTIKPAPKVARPSFLKAYPCRPRLRNRIFIPGSRKPFEELPVYLNLHGGGHALCDAQFDDEFCSTLANQFNILVVSIEYSSAPRSKFPEPTNDVVAIAQGIIGDEDLPIDKTRVVLGGFSAGGNLALSAAQISDLKDELCGVVCWYPSTDFSLTSLQKQHSRPYRAKEDLYDLKGWGPLWNWAYIRPGQNIRDPLLSVRYAQADNLLRWIFMIGAQYDMLANEARDTIFDLAGLDEVEKREGFDGFSKGTYNWKLVKDVRHGFTHNLMNGRSKEADAIDRMRTEQMVNAAGQWLFGGPFGRGTEDSWTD